MARTTPENCRFPLGICTTSNTWFLGPTRVFIQNAITIDSAVFAQLTVVSHYCTIGRYVSPKRDFVTLSEKDRATAMGNKHKKRGKDRACGSGDVLADRQTHTHTDVLITILCHRSCGRRNKHQQ